MLIIPFFLSFFCLASCERKSAQHLLMPKYDAQVNVSFSDETIIVSNEDHSDTLLLREMGFVDATDESLMLACKDTDIVVEHDGKRYIRKIRRVEGEASKQTLYVSSTYHNDSDNVDLVYSYAYDSLYRIREFVRVPLVEYTLKQ